MMERNFCNYSNKTPIIKGERKFYIKVSLLVFLVWLILFELVGRYAAKLPTHDITSFFDKQIPLVPQFIWPYMMCYSFPFLPLLVVEDYHRLNFTPLSIILANFSAFILYFIKIAPENPVLWTGMKGASADSRKKQTRC